MNAKENPFLNILFNIIVPVIILNKGSGLFENNGSLYSLLIALTFPIVYGLKDYIVNKKLNYFSIIGLINTILTGGFALFQLKGSAFAIKEAAIPLILGLLTIGSVYFKKPFMHWFVFKSNLFKSTLIQEKIEEQNNLSNLKKIIDRSTLYLASSFFLSAILNFIIAKIIFIEIDPTFDVNKKAQILNQQIADMTWMGYVIIALPLSIILAIILYHLSKKISELTNIPFKDLIVNPK